MERHLQTPKLMGKGPTLVCPASQWLDASVVPHSLPDQTLSLSAACSAGPVGSRALAGDALLSSVPELPASMQQLRDPRLKVDAENPQGASARLHWASDQLHASTQGRPLTPPQTVPQHNQFWLEGPCGNGPPAGPLGLRTVPLIRAPAGAPSLQPGLGSDDGVAITPRHRQTWDWSHGPLYSFRALCRAPIQQHQQQQLLIAAQRGLHTSSAHMSCASDNQMNWQNYLPLPLPLPDCSKKSYLSSQQSSLPAIGHRSSSACRPSSAPPAYSNELFSLHHELLPFCSSSSAQQPHQPQRLAQCSSSPTSPVLLPSSSPHPGPLQLPQLVTGTSSSAIQLSPTKQHAFGYPSATSPAAPSALMSLPAYHDASLFSSSAFQHTVRPAPSLIQHQTTPSPSASRALCTPLPWQTNTSFDFPVVCGSPSAGSVSRPLGDSEWSPDAVVPRNTCKWSPDPRLMVGDGKTQQKAHTGAPWDAEVDLQELHRSTMDWMASELVSAGSHDASLPV